MRRIVHSGEKNNPGNSTHTPWGWQDGTPKMRIIAANFTRNTYPKRKIHTYENKSEIEEKRNSEKLKGSIKGEP